jgi:hypothetical protein
MSILRQPKGSGQTHNNDRPNMGIGGITPAMKLKWPREFY